MQVFKVNDRINIVCEAKSTRSGFKHEATLIINGRDYGTVKVCYLNRTWERFTYQTVISKLKEKITALTPIDKALIQSDIIDKY